MRSTKRNLVIVRAGDQSLHPEWLGSDDSWDLIISYFGKDPALYRDVGNRIDAPGPKWPCLGSLINELSPLLSSYDYVFFPDDDLRILPGAIDTFFSSCRKHDLKLAQPALALESYVAHEVTIHNPKTSVRFTNYVELMAPCFRADALQVCSPTFGTNISGWGLDVLWPILLRPVRGRIGIVDDAQVVHTRPFGGPNYVHNKPSGLTPAQELLAVLKTNGIKRTCIEVEAVIPAHSEAVMEFNLAVSEQLVAPVAPWLM